MPKHKNRETYEILEQLKSEGRLELKQWMRLLSSNDEETHAHARITATEITREYFGNHIFIRGLIEFSNYCKNNCLYCGIRHGNHNVSRYRLSLPDILECCRNGYSLGFRTFVLQSGEDPYFTDERMVEIIRAIKSLYPDCALTLSIGERNREAFEAFYAAGADRYLLRHETANTEHYAALHPHGMSLETRMRCLWDLRDIGFQTGCGLMVGSPGQTTECLAGDFLFMQEFRPHMVGIGPFLPHHDTPFHNRASGTLEQTLFLLSLTRIMLKNVLLPATTALATIHPKGREMGIQCGANVVMPNLSPSEVRSNYLLYDNKRSMGDEAAEGLAHLNVLLSRIGYQTVQTRGDWCDINIKENHYAIQSQISPGRGVHQP